MFLEPSFKGQRSGWIEVICGSMFSGKTEELIRRLKRAKIANQKVQIFKPSKDTRYDIVNVVSHDENAIASIPVQSSLEIFDPVSYTHLDVYKRQGLLSGNSNSCIRWSKKSFIDIHFERY